MVVHFMTYICVFDVTALLFAVSAVTTPTAALAVTTATVTAILFYSLLNA